MDISYECQCVDFIQVHENGRWEEGRGGGGGVSGDGGARVEGEEKGE